MKICCLQKWVKDILFLGSINYLKTNVVGLTLIVVWIIFTCWPIVYFVQKLLFFLEDIVTPKPLPVSVRPCSLRSHHLSCQLTFQLFDYSLKLIQYSDLPVLNMKFRKVSLSWSHFWDPIVIHGHFITWYSILISHWFLFG